MSPSQAPVRTRFFIVSDTHGEGLRPESLPKEKVDVAIHCGDLTEESKLEEYRASLDLLRQIDADLKLVIAGNHDLALDIPMLKKKLEEGRVLHETSLIKSTYGDFGEASQLLTNARSEGIIFLDEGTYEFVLRNGAKLKVFASPFTPSTNDWAFQYNSQQPHEFKIEADTDVVITHGPPQSILDRAPGKNLGCPDLFAAVAQIQPKLHCFGHIHSGWGGRMVRWRDHMGENPTHFTEIDYDPDDFKKTLAHVTPETPCYSATHAAPENDGQTLFINAAIEGSEEHPRHPSWIVDVDLDQA